MAIKDIFGKKFGKLLVLNKIKKIGYIKYARCLCDCGKKIWVRLSNLKSGNSKSCGCLKKGAASKNRIDRSGQIFNYWEIVSYQYTANKKCQYLCRCRCGKESIRPVKDIVSGATKSCGCIENDLTRGTHRKSKSRIHNIWVNMRARCNKPNSDQYCWYGGRGIKVCERWDSSFLNFYNDVGEPPTIKHTLDRYPNKDGDYEPGNVRWTTMKEQSNNRTSNVLFEINGVIHNLTQWCDIYKINYKAVHQRLSRGADILTALQKPISTKSKNKSHATRI